jgi:glyoxylase I family protein
VAFPGLQHIRHHCHGPGTQRCLVHAPVRRRPVLDEDEESGTFHYTVFVLDGGMLFGLQTHTAGRSGDQADETRTGLNHIGFALADTTELEQWRDRLEELGMAHGGIKMARYRQLVFKGPLVG